MDSITQILLGASVAAVAVPAEHRRKALLIGAVLGTLPDLDVFIDYGDAVSNFTNHRGFSHSLFILAPFSLFVWAIFYKYYDPVKIAPKQWLLAIALTLLTHPLLDAHTAYGTQLLWPLTTPPVMWTTIFIIDPLYSLPLLFGVIIALFKPELASAKKALSIGLIVSTGYLTWTWVAKHIVESHVLSQLEEHATTGKVFSTPTPFNTLVWRIVIMKEDHYLEVYYSLLQPQRPITFQRYENNINLLKQTNNLWSVQRLHWFSQGFIKADIIDGQLVISDLRMGFEENYVFKLVVANKINNQWLAIDSTLLDSKWDSNAIDIIWDKLKNP